MTEHFGKSLLGLFVGGMSGVATYAADVTSPILQVAAGMVSYFIAEALIFRAD